MTSQWKPGTSGNPRGRPKGSGEIGRIRAEIAERLPEVLKVLVEKAIAGDISAARLLLDRTVPPLRAQEHSLSIALPHAGSFTEQGRAVIRAVSQEEIDPQSGSALVSSIAQLARVAEIDELTTRITNLEERMRCATSKSG